MTNSNNELLFSQTNEQEETEIEINEENPLEPFLGEKGKYKTPADLAKALIAKDRFINQLKTENAAIRDGMKASATAQELMDKLLSEVNKPRQQEAPVTTPEQRAAEADAQRQGLSITDLQKVLDEREKRNTENSNVKFVKDELSKKFGGSWQDELKNTAASLGMSADELEQMARRNPQAVVKIVSKPTVNQSAQNIPNGTVRLPGASDSGVRNNAFYMKLQKEMGSKFFDHKIQRQMHADMAALGDKFL